MKIREMIFLILAIILFTVSFILYFNLQEQKKRNIELIQEISNKIPLEIIDSNNVRKTGLETTVKEMQLLIKKTTETVDRIMRERNQKPVEHTIIKTKTVYDTIKLTSDTIITIDEKKYGIFKKDSKWYYIEAMANTDDLIIKKLINYEKLVITKYETEDIAGIYITSLNPNTVIDSVNYFYTKQRPKLFNAGFGFKSNLNFNNKEVFITAGYKQYNIIAGYNLTQGIKRKNIVLKDFTAGFMLQFRF